MKILKINNKKEESFKDIIERKIRGMDTNQITFFAWLCGVRALPFLSAEGSFQCWRIEDRLKLYQVLYQVLYALDIAAVSASSSVYSAHTFSWIAKDTIDSAFVSYAVASASDAASDAFAASDTFAAYAAASYAADAAAYAAAAIDTIAAYADDSAAAAAYASTIAAKYYKINLEGIILNDITYIKTNSYAELNNDVSIYGRVWDDFQDGLKALGCSYWGELYAHIFENRFIQDKEYLKRRVFVPREIQEQGAEAVAKYLPLLSRGSKRLNEARIIILGEKGAGKTCLSRRLVEPGAQMTTEEESTEGVETSIWKIASDSDELAVNAHIWDFAGHVITHAAHRCFLSERCLYIIVYDGRSEERNRLNYWLDHIRNYGNDAPVRVLVNVKDKHMPDIAENTLKNKYPFIIDFTYLSIAKDRHKLQVFRERTSEIIQTNLLWNNLKIPTNYFTVKEALERQFQKGNENFLNEHIKLGDFKKLAADAGIKSNGAKQLLKDLHALGICLWYEDLEEFDTLVLNPDWISQGIYTLINWAHKNEKHTISIDDYLNIFIDEKRNRYPKDKFLFILQLMSKYELAFSKDSEKNFTIPLLLKEDRPDNDIVPVFNVTDSLMLKFETESALPPNIASRLIVRYYKEIRDEKEVWRHGVILKRDKDTIALVEEDERRVTVCVKGRAKSSYIAELREALLNIFDSYKASNPDLYYKIIVNEPIESSSFTMHGSRDIAKATDMISDEVIRGHILHGNNHYFDYSSGRQISLRDIIKIYMINTGGVFDMGNTYIQSAESIQINETVKTAVQNNYHQSNSNELPNDITQEQWKQLVDLVNRFLDSDESDKLSKGDCKVLKRNIEESDYKKGWGRFREYLADTANVATVLAPLAAFVTSNGDQISQSIKMLLFKS